jgi:hypothetical protein
MNLVGPSNRLENTELLHPWEKQPAHLKRYQYFLDVLVGGVAV